MKKLVLLLAVSVLLVLGCNRKDKNNPDPLPEEIKITELTDPDFIQYIEVANSQKIVFDSALNAYIVTLAPNFVADEVNITFKFYPGAFLSTGHSGKAANLIEFTHKNRPPLTFQVSSAAGKVNTYELYVQAPGPLKAAIDPMFNFRYGPQDYCAIPIELISGIGTIPESPGSEIKPAGLLKDDKTGKEIAGGIARSYLYFANASNLSTSENIRLTLKYGEKSLVLAENKKLAFQKSVVYLMGDSPLFKPLSLNKKTLIIGDGFSKNSHYTIKIESDFLQSAVTMPAIFEDSAQLSFILPASLQNGSYAVSVFDNEVLINSIVLTISMLEAEKSIGQIWLTPNDYPVAGALNYFVARRVVLDKGRSLYASPFPAVLGTMYAGFDPSKTLPDLQLKNSGKTFTLKATVKSDPTYADGTMRFYYGQYTPTPDIPAGLYEARLLYPDLTVSSPFWSKIEVR
jgi:hypothetical protein